MKSDRYEIFYALPHSQNKALESSSYINYWEEGVYFPVQFIGGSGCYSASSAQQRIYALQSNDLNSTSYNMPVIFEVEGKLDFERLDNAFRKLIQRHEALRTSFILRNDELLQIVHQQVEFKLEALDNVLSKDVFFSVYDAVIKSFIKPFNLDTAPLLRAGLIEISSKRSMVLVDIHQIVSDNAAIEILFEDLIKAYKGVEMPPLKIQYKDFCYWQNMPHQSHELSKQEEYWLDKLGKSSILNLPTDYQRPVVRSLRGDLINFEIDKALTYSLRKLSEAMETTMYTILMAVFNVLLLKYTSQEDIIVGSSASGRTHPDIRNTLGRFDNILAIRSFPKGEQTFREFLAEVKQTLLEANENQDYRHEKLVDKLELPRGMSRSPVFDVMFEHRSIGVNRVEVDEIIASCYEVKNNISRRDIILTAVEYPENMHLRLEYCIRLFKKETMKRMFIHLRNIIQVIVSDIDIKLSDIDILTSKEKQQLLVDFNNTSAEYPKNMPIQKLFEEQASKMPDNIAVVYQDMSLTYRQLNEKANQLARVLVKQDAAKSIVAIMADPSLEMIIGIMGILKAGAAYLPIDPRYGRDRIKYMLADSETKIILTQAHLTSKLEFEKQIILMDSEDLYEGDNTNLHDIGDPKDISYIVYTSGSNGRPKGVVLEHCSLANMCAWYINCFGVTAEDRGTKYAGFGFDASVWEIFPFLLAGAAIHIIGEEMKRGIDKLHEYIEKNNITVCFLPTQVCEQFMKRDNKSLRYLLTGGDKLKQYISRSYKIVNNYGPSENTVVTTYFVLDKQYVNIPIGKPISNNQAYVLDKYNKLCPVGVAGELCISGDSLARGYLNRDDLTEEKFVDNPFEKGKKMYHAGDLVRWLPDGNLEYLGRVDYQVKIRGCRIDLGEIENQLHSMAEISEALVIVRDDAKGNNRIHAYIVPDKQIAGENNKLDIPEIKERLRKELPQDMLPAYFIQLDELPLTPNGKVDRKALPEPEDIL